MGNESVILWLSAELALGYFMAVVIGMVGVLQLVALRSGREDLRWLPGQVVAPVAVIMIVSAASWFYLRFYPLIFVPGPAGLELIILFGGGTAFAVWITRLLNWLAKRSNVLTLNVEPS